MKGIHWSVWAALVVLILLVVLLSARKEGYAPPRDENTQPPYTENVGNVATTSNNLPYIESTSNLVVDNQTQIYKDMGGLDFQIQAGNPILNFIQGDPSSNVIYGDFVPNESDGGSARMYAYEDREMIESEPAQQLSNNCPHSVAIIPNKNLTLTEGTYPIDKDSYIINVYPPLHVVVTGPGGERDERNYPATEACPSMVKLALDKEKMYDTLILTSDITIKQSLAPIPENPTTRKNVYAIDVYGNIINPMGTEIDITKEENAASNLRYGFDAKGNEAYMNYIDEKTGKIVTRPYYNARDYGFDEPVTPPDAGQYIPTLTSPTIPFLGDQPGISFSESPVLTTSPVITRSISSYQPGFNFSESPVLTTSLAVTQ
jgi:hypothetical protein